MAKFVCHQLSSIARGCQCFWTAFVQPNKLRQTQAFMLSLQWAGSALGLLMRRVNIGHIHSFYVIAFDEWLCADPWFVHVFIGLFLVNIVHLRVTLFIQTALQPCRSHTEHASANECITVHPSKPMFFTMQCTETPFHISASALHFSFWCWRT